MESLQPFPEVIELEYWKTKSKLLQLRVEELQLEAALTDVLIRRMQLGYVGNYRFNDQDFTITEIKNV